MYRLSKDYEALFRLLLKGETAVGFVDYKLHNNGRSESHVLRDVCAVKRRGDYQIYFGVRGTGYASIDPYMIQDGDEKEIFIGACKSLNLEWIEPASTQTAAQSDKP